MTGRRAHGRAAGRHPPPAAPRPGAREADPPAAWRAI